MTTPVLLNTSRGRRYYGWNPPDVNRAVEFLCSMPGLCRRVHASAGVKITRRSADQRHYAVSFVLQPPHGINLSPADWEHLISEIKWD